MPYFKYRNQRKYEYELASGQFNYDDLSSDARQVFDLLREFGAKVVCCRYNGGGDEGFAYFERVELEDKTVSLNDLKYQLAEGLLGSKTSQYLHSYYREEPLPEQRVEFFLELFADELAIYLLGSGYGTGEYSMKGFFNVNLESGEIIDEQVQ
jgi:hypothetical protein